MRVIHWFRTHRLAAVVAIALIIAAGFSFAYQRRAQRPHVFIQHWSERFRRLDDLVAAKQVEQTTSAVVRTFSSGEWLIATCEHACCGGAGYNATVIRDSSGSIYSETTHTFC